MRLETRADDHFKQGVNADDFYSLSINLIHRYMSQVFAPNESRTVNDNNEQSTSKNYLRYDPDDDDRMSDETQVSNESSISQNEAIASVMKQSQWTIKTDSSVDRSDFSRICSFCLIDSSEDKVSNDRGSLITACLCTGRRSHSHERCIGEWIEQTGANSCPFCNVRYEFTRKKKSFLCYITECGLKNDFIISAAALAYSFHLFIVGLSVCYNFLFSNHECDSESVRNLAILDSVDTIEWSDWSELENIVECRRSVRQFKYAHSWSSTILFCITCIGTIFLFVTIISLCLNMVFRHYIRYMVWTKTSSRVSVKSYRLNESTNSRSNIGGQRD